MIGLLAALLLAQEGADLPPPDPQVTEPLHRYEECFRQAVGDMSVDAERLKQAFAAAEEACSDVRAETRRAIADFWRTFSAMADEETRNAQVDGYITAYLDGVTTEMRGEYSPPSPEAR